MEPGAQTCNPQRRPCPSMTPRIGPHGPDSSQRTRRSWDGVNCFDQILADEGPKDAPKPEISDPGFSFTSPQFRRLSPLPVRTWNELQVLECLRTVRWSRVLARKRHALRRHYLKPVTRRRVPPCGPCSKHSTTSTSNQSRRRSVSRSCIMLRLAVEEAGP
jgi:hypothetical protein